MRRMYSKEQLNKLIEEVSKLIAIEELDKVVPVPDISKAGYVMKVNAAGTGYELVSVSALTIDGTTIRPANCYATGEITANSIIENMSGYSGEGFEDTLTDLNVIYAGCVKTGNKITFSLFFSFTYDSGKFKDIFRFNIPSSVGALIYPYTLGGEPLASELSVPVIKARNEIPVNCYGEIYKPANDRLIFSLSTSNATLEANATYLCRMECTFLLSENLAQ